MSRIEQVEKRGCPEWGRGGDARSKLKKRLLEDAPMFLGPPPPVVNAPVLSQRGRVRISVRRKCFL